MLTNGEINDITRIDAVDANKPYTGRRGNYVPPYTPNSSVWDFTTTKEVAFVRVHVTADPKGGFVLMSEKEFERLNGEPEAIRQYLRLKDRPEYISDIHVPTGTKMRAGIIGAQPKMGFYSSSGVQFELIDKIPIGNFQNTRRLK